MQEIINKIVKQNKSLFGDNPNIDKINVGFTNTIYSVNDKYIIKILVPSLPRFRRTWLR